MIHDESRCSAKGANFNDFGILDWNGNMVNKSLLYAYHTHHHPLWMTITDQFFVFLSE